MSFPHLTPEKFPRYLIPIQAHDSMILSRVIMALKCIMALMSMQVGYYCLKMEKINPFN